MSDSQGRFVWYELMTTDTAAAAAFYGKVVGWGSQDTQVSGTAYSMFTAGETPVGGLMDLPEDARKAGAGPMWLGYVAVDDVDGATDRAKSLGGRVHVPPRDVPNIGRFSVIADPQTAPLALFAPSGPRPSPAAEPGTPGREPGPPGRVGWHELLAGDRETAFAFYRALFGWEKADAVDIGAMGVYQLFSAGGQTIGGMFTKPPMVPRPFWLYYFVVGDIDAAADRVRSGGGQVANGPMDVPGGGWILQGLDPQGAMFALLGRRD